MPNIDLDLTTDLTSITFDPIRQRLTVIYELTDDANGISITEDANFWLELPSTGQTTDSTGEEVEVPHPEMWFQLPPNHVDAVKALLTYIKTRISGTVTRRASDPE